VTECAVACVPTAGTAFTRRPEQKGADAHGAYNRNALQPIEDRLVLARPQGDDASAKDQYHARIVAFAVASVLTQHSVDPLDTKRHPAHRPVDEHPVAHGHALDGS
jgi:hypothetical protein